MNIKSFYTQQHCYVSLKTSYPGGIRTRVFFGEDCEPFKAFSVRGMYVARAIGRVTK
jgi:hypothetical protein